MKKIVALSIATTLLGGVLSASAYNLDEQVFNSPQMTEYTEHDLDNTVFQSPDVNLDEQEFQNPDIDLDEQEFQYPNLGEQVFQGEITGTVYQFFTDADYDDLLGCQESWKLANDQDNEQGKVEAHAKAEEIRANYGFSGGADGSLVIKL